MDEPLLKSGIRRPGIGLRGISGIAGLISIKAWAAVAVSACLLGLGGCRLFNDADLELDPALRDSSLTAMSADELHPTIRYHLLESFGSFGCVSCPEAESRLSPYLHPELGNPAYDSRVFIVNYHVKFGTVPDPWVTPTIQGLNDALGYASLPQAVMDGSNAAYGIRETDVSFRNGEYDSLIARAGRADSSAWLELSLDSTLVRYDSSANRIRFRFVARNHGAAPLGPMDFRVLAVKNQSVAIPIYPTQWEAIVVEASDQDGTGKALSLAGLNSLTAKAFDMALTVTPEAPKHIRPPPLGPEPLSDYSLIVMARDRQGALLNVKAWKYRPLLTPK